MDRKAYSQLYAKDRRRSSEMLRHFKEANPEAYERLLARARQELDAEKTLTPLQRLNAPRTLRPFNDLDDLIFLPGTRHYFILTSDNRLSFRTYSVNAPLVERPDCIVVRCNCMKCKERDIAENTPYDYTQTQELLDRYFQKR